VILAEAYRAFLLDLDGVVYRGREPVPDAADALARLRAAGRSVVFLTNNSARTPHQIVEKLRTVEVDADPAEVVTSAQALASLLGTRGRSDGDRTAYVIGEDGVREALVASGIRVVDGEPDRAGYVVVGWDRGVTYEALRTASVLVGRGATLVATNSDPSYPAEGGELWPGAGAILAAVETATGVRAEVAGKPHTPLFEEALRRAGADAGDAVVIGDRIETDVAGARAARLDSILVWTGAASPADLLDHDALPTATVPTLAALFEDRPAPRIRPAGPEDAEEIAALLQKTGLDPGESPDVEGSVVASEDGLVATAAVDVQGTEGYLRSVAVQEEARGSGIGALVTAAAARGAAGQGVRRLFLLTEIAEGFFARLGFSRTERGSLPAWVRKTGTACSESAVAMARALPRAR
jgi:HAD superfamily hydrolase (TIGR01457 family)